MVGQQKIPRPEYPRPQLVRENNWINLNGTWKFAFDDENQGLREKWHQKTPKDIFKKGIVVPFCFQSKLSGIHDESFHDIIWYYRNFSLSKEYMEKRILLQFGAVDYYTQVYINGDFVGSHKGGYTPFTIDITEFIKTKNSIVLRVEDPSKNNEIPRGKQFWKKEPGLIFYPRVSGIWQTVWIEAVNKSHHLKKLKLIPDINESALIVECHVSGTGSKDLRIRAQIKSEEKVMAKFQTKLDFLGDIEKKRKRRNLIKQKLGVAERIFNIHPANAFQFKINIPKEHLILWSIENPFLYDLILQIYNNETQEIYDETKSYFGMREISLSDGPIEILTKNETIKTNNRVVLLNKKPVYQKLFLSQGYWADGLYTAPSDEAFKRDINFIKEFGFNGLRTHQKAFDPRFLYWCDKIGILIWGEMGSPYVYSTHAQKSFINEYIEMVERDYNHPSLIAWTILNEGWGVAGAEYDKKKAYYTESLYYLIKSIDPTRLIIDDDGWYHAKTDLCTKHFYSDLKLLPDNFQEEKRMKYPEDYEPSIYLNGFSYHNEPIIYSEVGGYTLDYHKNIDNPFGYGKVDSSDDLLNLIVNLLKEFDKRKEWIHGICYTELYDQFQEINGLLTMKREPKFSPKKLKEQIDKLFY